MFTAILLYVEKLSISFYGSRNYFKDSKTYNSKI